MSINHSTQNYSLTSLGMVAVLVAQFFSALADNAILIAAIAIVKLHNQAYQVPWLQEAFVLPFILLAPFSGQIADAFPKGRVMLLANLVKLCGAALMLFGVSPLLSYALIGIGAAAYSPAKYGILSQMFGIDKLVKANGLLEGLTIVAILIGVVLGGILADYSLTTAFAGVIACYTLASLANLLIPRLVPENDAPDFRLASQASYFANALKTLFGNKDARFSLFGTSVFWGSGITLRLVLFAWVPLVLGISDNQTPSTMMGVMSIGIVLGALAAGMLISLAKVSRVLWGGLLLGPLVFLMAFIADKSLATLIMVAIGFCGGLFVVPLNALLQKRGHETVGAGNARAVQSFAENICMLLFVGAYSLVSGAGISIQATFVGFGVLLLLAMLANAAQHFRQKA